MRKFEEVGKEELKFPDVETKLPQRSDSQAAGYDFYSKETYKLWPGESHIFWTDVKALMFFDNVLNIYPRSGLGCKNGVVLRNNVGIIDASYQKNIGICLVNNSEEFYEVNVGDKIAQGVFTRYLITDDDQFIGQKIENTRTGGFGSSGK